MSEEEFEPGIIKPRDPDPLGFDEDRFPPELVNAIRLGVEVEDFLKKTKVGIYLYNRAMEEMTEATHAMLGSSTLDDDEIKEAHRRGYAANMFLSWLNDALADAKNAETQLENEYVSQTEEGA